jgi:hypothetical protein
MELVAHNRLKSVAKEWRIDRTCIAQEFPLQSDAQRIAPYSNCKNIEMNEHKPLDCDNLYFDAVTRSISTPIPS